MKTPRQLAGGFTEKTLLVKNLLVLSFHYPINILLDAKRFAVSRGKYEDKRQITKHAWGNYFPLERVPENPDQRWKRGETFSSLEPAVYV